MNGAGPATSVALLAFATAAIGTGLLRRWALRRKLLDQPNERSSHSMPTPRGGGAAIVAVASVAFGTLALAAMLEARIALALLVGGLAVAAIGFADDHGHVPARFRLMVHAGAAALAVWALGGAPVVPVGAATLALGWVGNLLAVITVVWVLNLYNFMDGIDGIASSEGVFVTGAIAGLVGPGSALFLPALAMAAACAGFLVFNWPPARIFMGDVGSGWMGFAVAVLLLAAALEGRINVWAGLILLGVFAVDATTTLIRRLLRGERVHEAHRSHAYQWSARRWGAHRPVTLATIAINLGWLLPWAAFAARHPETAMFAAAAALVPMVGVALALGAGRREQA